MIGCAALLCVAILMAAGTACADSTDAAIPDQPLLSGPPPFERQNYSDPVNDSVRAVLLDSLRQQMQDDSTQQTEYDSVLARLRGDTVGAETPTPQSVLKFQPPSAVFDSVDSAYAAITETPNWPIPHPADLATGDLGDWLTFIPTYDVDDAPGPGQPRLYSHWGLQGRATDFTVDGEIVPWMRLHIPQTARFDPMGIASFDFDTITAGDRINLQRTSEWPSQAKSSFFLRQGDFSETYSQGRFRRLYSRGYGVDFGFAFYENQGRYFADNRDNRYLRLQIVGPFRNQTFWSVRFVQFRDKTMILVPDTFTEIAATRDDLSYTLEGMLYRPPDSVRDGWKSGVTIRSAKHKALVWAKDRVVSLWGEHLLAGWKLHAEGMINDFDSDSTSPSRWGALIEGRRIWQVGTFASAATELRLSDYDTDPLAVDLSASIAADRSDRRFVPTLKISRTRYVPSLFDRQGRGHSLALAGTPISQYSEIGDPGLDAEWRNELNLSLATRPDSTPGAMDFVIQGHVGYAENYTRWTDANESLDTASYRPVSDDARTVGIALGLHAPLFWKLDIWTSYAAKYAETLDKARLEGYYPHKASAIVSWIAPQFRYKIDLRINSALIWWYGDPRTTPTLYASSPHVLRWDLSASARMASFTFYYSIQNVLNYQYRTGAGQGFTAQTMRFGIKWLFLD